MNIGAIFETALLSPVLQSALRNADPFGQFGSTLVAESLAGHDETFTRLVEASLGGQR